MSAPNEKQVKELEEFLNEFSGDILETSRDLIEAKFTEFPMYLVHKDNNIEIGQILLDRVELETNFYISVSTLEEFLDNGFVDPDKQKEFKKAYGDPLKQMCVLWIVGDQAHFVFFPFGNRVGDDQKGD